MSKDKMEEVVLTEKDILYQRFFLVATLLIIDSLNWSTGLNVMVKVEMSHNKRVFKRCGNVMKMQVYTEVDHGKCNELKKQKDYVVLLASLEHNPQPSLEQF